MEKNPNIEHLVYVDQYTGKILVEHEGRQYKMFVSKSEAAFWQKEWQNATLEQVVSDCRTLWQMQRKAAKMAIVKQQHG